MLLTDLVLLFAFKQHDNLLLTVLFLFQLNVFGLIHEYKYLQCNPKCFCASILILIIILTSNI